MGFFSGIGAAIGSSISGGGVRGFGDKQNDILKGLLGGKGLFGNVSSAVGGSNTAKSLGDNSYNSRESIDARRGAKVRRNEAEQNRNLNPQNVRQVGSLASLAMGTGAQPPLQMPTSIDNGQFQQDFIAKRNPMVDNTSIAPAVNPPLGVPNNNPMASPSFDSYGKNFLNS